MTYKDKLRDPRWQKRRLEIFQRDDWQCCICHQSNRNLQVHHIVYAKLDPWDYPDHLLQTLCDECHETRQELTDKASNGLRIALAKVPTPRLQTVANRIVAEAFQEVGL
jgi:5-methylcytosine-specific restriction endonuclease McrA